MSIQNNEMMTTATRSNFLLPQAVETTFTAEELAEDMDGIQLNFQQVKVPAGGALQYEIPTEDPDNPDYSRYLEGARFLRAKSVTIACPLSSPPAAATAHSTRVAAASRSRAFLRPFQLFMSGPPPF